MKKFLLSMTLMLLSATSLFAVRAKQGICQLQLADGTIVSATLHGDENFHYYTLLDGTPLQESSIKGKYEKINLAELQEKQTASFQAMQARAAKAASIGSITPFYFPHVGSPKALVILVQFQDVKFKSSDPVATFNHYLNGKMGEAMPEADQSIFSQKEEHTNYGSVKQYFTDMSHGKFTPQFDIVGPVTVSEKSAFYGSNQGGDDKNYTVMMTEACQLVDNQINFADYDSNNDGYVDLVYFIYAGYSESIHGNSSDCLWPKSGTASIGTFDNKRVRRFGINNELNGTPKDLVDGKYLFNGIGLFCHEFSHTMGIPDLYPTSDNASTANNQSPEYWDLMDMGEYTNDGYCPTPYSPWEKSIMGWVEPTTLSNTKPSQIELEPYYLNSKALKINADDDDDNEKKGEYLLLQNIVNKGWSQYLPGYGLLVWRIDYADKDYVKMSDYPNNTYGKPRVMVVPADGMLLNSANCGDGATYSTDEYLESLENDPFPMYKKGSATEYEVNSLTSVELNHGSLTSRPLYNITKNEETGMVTFDYLKDYSAGTGIRGIENNGQDRTDNRPTEYFDLEGRKIPHPQKGHLYVTKKGKKIIF